MAFDLGERPPSPRAKCCEEAREPSQRDGDLCDPRQGFSSVQIEILRLAAPTNRALSYVARAADGR